MRGGGTQWGTPHTCIDQLSREKSPQISPATRSRNSISKRDQIGGGRTNIEQQGSPPRDQSADPCGKRQPISRCQL
jgi:hypothetical protein